MQLSVKPNKSVATRAKATWNERSVVVRSVAVTGVSVGLVSLAQGVSFSTSGGGMVATALPIFFGSIWGPVTFGEIRRLRASPIPRLDPADWARLIASAVFVIAVTITSFLPRMRPGSGYLILGAALITSAIAAFWQLPKDALESADTRGPHADNN
jgi:hypothetical protein